MPGFPSLERDAWTDIVIVGGGFVGLSIAYQLARDGRRVVVLERYGLVSGETPRTSAQLTASLDFRYSELMDIHGRERVRRVAESHTAAIDEVERIVREEGIECEFERVPGYLFSPAEQRGDLVRELHAMRDSGLNVDFVDAPDGTRQLGPCVRLEGQGSFHPVKYLAGLVRALQRMGVEVFTSSPVVSYDANEVRTEGGARVMAQQVVLATNTPVADRVKFSFRLISYRTYMLALELRGEVPRAHFWDTLDPYHYVRPHGNVLLVGGEDHVVGRADDAHERYARLEAWAREHFPVGAAVERWSGQVENTPDGLAYIGPSGGVFVVTGDVGNGLSHGVIGSILIRDAIAGRVNPWAEVYDATRLPRGGRREWLKEGMRSASQLAEWVTPGDDLSSVQVGEGVVVRRGLKKIAVHRDEAGNLQAVSAVCSHLGCVVRWNSDERSWDCPCHGSRYAAGGEVLHGPARTGLSPVVF